MRTSKYRYLIPNSITYLSLTCGIVSILMAGSGALTAAGLFILASYVLDLFDGELARRLDAGTEFGLQLDSLVDMVSLGVAPAAAVFFYLQDVATVPALLLWPAVIFYVMAGAFRLARFNLLPMKEGQVDSIGLTISTSGATLALAVLSDVFNSSEVIPDFFYLPLLIILGLLMVSRISYPSLVWVFSRRWLNFLYMVYFAASVFLLNLPIFFVGFLFTGGYHGIAIMRAGYRIIEE
jgi:CDP-diacylglycerol--serine O-phosphatidyltransferase